VVEDLVVHDDRPLMPRSRPAIIVGLTTLIALPTFAAPLRTREDVVAAMTRAREACNEDEATACHDLALLSERHPSLGVGYSQQVAFSAKACTAGAMEACTTWGRLLYSGPVVDHDLDRISKLWSDSCDGGSVEGCRRLASLFAHREAEPKGTSTLLKEARLQGAYEALSFDAQRARVLARPLLADPPLADRARLVLACADIADQRWEQALTKVEDRRTVDPAYAVLGALIKERHARPKEPWTDAYVRAWAAAGRPDLRQSMLFSFAPPLPRSVVPLPEDPQLRFVVDFAAWAARLDERPDEWSEPPSNALLGEALAQATSTDPLIQRLALRVLLASDDPHAHGAAKPIIEAWRAAEPDNVLPALIELFELPGWNRGITESSQTRLDQTAALPSYRSPRYEAFQYLLAELSQFYPAAALDVALRTSRVAAFDHVARILLRSADSSVGAASSSPGAHFASVLPAIGAKFQTANTEEERALGKVLVDWRESTPTAHLERSEVPAPRWSANSADLLLAWPLSHLREEAYFRLAENEIHFRKHLDEVLAGQTDSEPPVSDPLKNAAVPTSEQ
jgi:hypothetical protein